MKQEGQKKVMSPCSFIVVPLFLCVSENFHTLTPLNIYIYIYIQIKRHKHQSINILLLFSSQLLFLLHSVELPQGLVQTMKGRAST